MCRDKSGTEIEWLSYRKVRKIEGIEIERGQGKNEANKERDQRLGGCARERQRAETEVDKQKST